MISQPYRAYIERKDDARNMARFYAMEISETLFGQACLTRRWGRIGHSGLMMVQAFDQEQQAVELFLALTRLKEVGGTDCP
jgi:predicted DNA-binding WGR domain protein